MTLVYNTGCLTGRIGAYRGPEDGSDYGKYGDMSCYENALDPLWEYGTDDWNRYQNWNDMAAAFGITPDTSAELPCGYIGYYDTASVGWDGYLVPFLKSNL